MYIKEYTDIKQFNKENLPFLENNEIINSKTIGNLEKSENYILKPEDILLSINSKYPELWALKLSGNTLTINGNIKYLENLVTHINENKSIFNEAFGTKEIIEKYISLTKINYQLEMETILYCLKNINDLNYSEGKLRKADISDKDISIEFLNGFFYDCFKEKDYLLAEKTFDRLIKEQSLFVWEDNNQDITSIAAIIRTTKNTASISYVYTPERFRKKGYATSITAKLSEYILDSGYKYCLLFADKVNEDSNKIYKNIGYQEVEEYIHIKIIEFQ